MGSATDKNFLGLILPQGILEYFLLTDFTSSISEICVYLEEKNVIPEEYRGDKLISKGFFDEVTVQDFPLSGKAVFLHIRRRRWLNQTTGGIVFRASNMVARGRRMIMEFASFLKALSGYQTGK